MRIQTCAANHVLGQYYVGDARTRMSTRLRSRDNNHGVEHPGWRDVPDEDRAFGEAAASAAQLNTELGLPPEAALMPPPMRHALAVQRATRVLNARGVDDPYGGSARLMARAVMDISEPVSRYL
jgi:hypothetical protein